MGKVTIYICPTCFETSARKEKSHLHPMLLCNIGELGDECRKPVKDQYGRLVSRAPRWYLEALGTLNLSSRQ